VGSVNGISTDIDLNKVEIVLLPVWMASWRHGETVHRQMVNGQTGKVIGEIPTSTKKVMVAVLVATVLAVLAYLAYLGATA
jgi:hypothetical protein